MDPIANDNRGAQALRALLKDGDGIKQADLARRIGISQSHLSRLSRAETVPKLREDALALAEAGIPAEWWDLPAEPEANPNHPADSKPAA